MTKYRADSLPLRIILSWERDETQTIEENQVLSNQAMIEDTASVLFIFAYLHAFYSVAF